MKGTRRLVLALLLIATLLPSTPTAANDEGYCKNDVAGEAGPHNPFGDLVAGCAFGFGNAVVIDWHLARTPEFRTPDEGLNSTSVDGIQQSYWRADLRDLDTRYRYHVGVFCIEGYGGESRNACSVQIGPGEGRFDRQVPRQNAQTHVQAYEWGLRLVLWNVFPHGHAYGANVGAVSGPGNDTVACHFGDYYNTDTCPHLVTDEVTDMPINTNARSYGDGVPQAPMTDCQWQDYVFEEKGLAYYFVSTTMEGPLVGPHWHWTRGEEAERDFWADLYDSPRACQQYPAFPVQPRPAPNPVPPAATGPVRTVTDVIDGDTIELDGGERVRLAIVDTPEFNECGGQQAADYTRAFLAARGNQVQLRRPADAPQTDEYGRTLAEVITQGASLNQDLYADGHGRIDERFTHEDPDLADRLRSITPAAGPGCAPGVAPPPSPPPPPPPPPTTSPPSCDPSYPSVCIPPPPPDLDCGDIAHRNFTVIGSDPHNFDGDNDGVGCET